MKSLARNLGIFVAHAERRYAKTASRELLDLMRLEQQEHPELKKQALYEAVIARRIGSNPTLAAAEIVRRAAETFADWPSVRELKFRDVVHYQVFNEYMRHGEVRLGTQTNIGVVVARIIPGDL